MTQFGLDTLETVFWFCAAVVVYTYVGYGLLVGLWAFLARRTATAPATTFEPAVTVVVPAYNEAAILAAKVVNCLALSYPADKVRGSAKKYTAYKLEARPKRSS